MKRHKQERHTFKVESMFDQVGEYTAICCAMTGEVLRHEGQKVEDEKQDVVQEDVKPKNQLELF